MEYNRTGKDYSRGDKLMNESGDKRDGNTINASYMKKFVPIAERQVELASVRLAQLLNDALVAGRPTP